MVSRTALRRPTIVIFLIVLWSLAPPTASATPRFHVECPFHHFKADDPIVYPRQPGQSHMHAFFGNKSTDAFSTYRSLRRARTNCGKRGDKGAYWMPAVFKNGHRVKPTDGDFYYRARTEPLGAIRAFPKGLKIIAGDHDATRPQSTKVIGWSCFRSAGTERPRMRDCGQADVKVLIHFPSCWDGLRTDSNDHMSHMAYSIKTGEAAADVPRATPYRCRSSATPSGCRSTTGATYICPAAPSTRCTRTSGTPGSSGSCAAWWTSASMPGSNARPSKRDAPLDRA